MGPGVLSDILHVLPKPKDENLIVGLDTSDDAAVYRINDEVAIIETVDFFPPMVDDPFTFGQVAAANALSDVYAMGGEPKLALNLLAFPSDKLAPEHVARILEGGASKVQEAGALLCGGHTIEDKEPKYGLCVTGIVDPRRVLTNAGAKPGDALILTKALGTGILSTAGKAGILKKEEAQALTVSMTTLNLDAARAMKNHEVHACTDITGFGLVGHALELAEGSGCTALLWADAFGVLPGAREYAAMGLVPAGAYRNRDEAEGRALIARDIPLDLADVAFDPQTSGGLLISVARGDAEALLRELLPSCPYAAIVGEARERGEYTLELRREE